LAGLVAPLLAARHIPKRSLLLLLATLLTTPAHAVTVTFGFWDASQGGGVTPIETTGDGTHTLANFYLGNNWGGVASWVSDPVTNLYELAVNVVFSSSADTVDSTRLFRASRLPPTASRSQPSSNLAHSNPVLYLLTSHMSAPQGARYSVTI